MFFNYLLHLFLTSFLSKLIIFVVFFALLLGDKSKRLNSQAKTEGIVEAMKKLDAKLVAYLAGETEISNKNSISSYEQENVVNLTLENNANSMRSDMDDDVVVVGHRHIRLDDELPATKLEIFKTITGVKLEIEALTLQPDGTKRMDLMQSDIRPIFTVECQLSNELIKRVPRHDMFNIMQFESEKFHSLTQCTRFGQAAERTVQLAKDENGNDVNELDMGRLQFTVWWREPGTCLNELLGMGVLELQDLYNASLLEQCKRIAIERRGKHLASLYFKITLQHCDFNYAANENFLKTRELNKLNSSDNEKNDNSQNSEKQQQQPPTGSSTTAGNSEMNNSSAATTVTTDKGEYADNFLYLKHNKIQ